MQVQIPVSLYTSLLQQQRLQEQLMATQPRAVPSQPTRKHATSSSFHYSLPVDLSALSAVSASALPSYPSTDASASKADFVENLVGTASLIIESIWPNHSFSSRSALLPLRKFIREILRRSRTSFSTLQLALLYIVRLRNQLSVKSAKEGPGARPHATLCGRRMFLSALIVAAKYLQDRNYSNKAWAKISGLPLEEINKNEFEILRILDYDLFVSQKTYLSWSTMLLARTSQIRKDPACPTVPLANAVSGDVAASAVSFTAEAASINPLMYLANSGGLLASSESLGAFTAPPTPAPFDAASVFAMTKLEGEVHAPAMTPPAEDTPSISPPSLTSASSIMSVASDGSLEGLSLWRSNSMDSVSSIDSHAMMMLMQPSNYPSPSASESSASGLSLSGKPGLKRSFSYDEEEDPSFLSVFEFGAETPASDDGALRKRVKA
ncbi:hypothetical protein HDU67_001592 [Dinochytrium kinnereticum]|nr:hypothetical protein HDU67_001592 [Dinochytrium kinnereticum]